MFDDAGRVMFTALHRAAVARLGPSHPCTAALAAAAAGPDATRVAAAETALRGLAAADREAIMAEVHRTLRSDPQAWLTLWPGGPARH